jgi:hypothetical protein
MNMAHIQRFLDSVQTAQHTNTPRIVLTLGQAQDLALDIGRVLAVAFAQQPAPVEDTVIAVSGGSFTDK